MSEKCKPELEFKGMSRMQGHRSEVRIYKKYKSYGRFHEDYCCTVVRSLHPRKSWWAVRYNYGYWPCWVDAGGRKSITVDGTCDSRHRDETKRYLVR